MSGYVLTFSKYYIITIVFVIFFAGMGLGRNNEGMVEPIKVKQRIDNSGIGHESKENFSHWWDFAYNKAVNNLTVVAADVSFGLLLLLVCTY